MEPTNATILDEPDELNVLSTDAFQTLYQLGTLFPGAWLVIAKGHVTTSSAEVIVRLDVGNATDEVRIGSAAFETDKCAFSLIVGTSVPVGGGAETAQLQARKINTVQGGSALVGRVKIVALTLDSLSVPAPAPLGDS